MKRFTAGQLESDPRFRQVSMLGYDSILPFVWRNIREINLSSRFYFFINIIYLVLMLGMSISGLLSHNFTAGLVFKYFFLGFLAGSFAVIPVHEAIHGLAYRMKGATGIRFGADFKQMLFYVVADRFVLCRKDFYFVALAPFAVINLISIILMFFTNGYWQLFLITFLLLHNIMCIGDFAMVSFFMKHKGKDLYTFDDHKRRISYIYERFSNTVIPE